jgi:tetratricopeptide (TPR) repeat protein
MSNKLLSLLILIVITVLTGCGSADNYYKDGRKNFESGNYEAAADKFSKAISANPDRAQYYIDYGLTLAALGKYEEALAQLNKAYINKDMSIIRKNNKRALRGMGITYYLMQDYENAVKEFDSALKIDELAKLDVDILYYMGSSYRAVGDYQMALATYNQLLIEDGSNAAAYADRAYCYRCMGEPEKSQSDYDSAISLKPNNFEYYFGKYDLLTEQGDNDTAQKVLQKAADIKVVTKEDKYNLAKLHFYQNSYDTALTELKDNADKGFSEADYYIGEIYRIDKDYTKAVYYYENYIKIGDIPAPNVYNQIAVCLIKTGEYQKAIDYLEIGATYHETGTTKFFMKNEIIAYEKLGDFKTANDKLTTYLKNYPGDDAAVREAEFIETRLMDAIIQ